MAASAWAHCRSRFMRSAIVEPAMDATDDRLALDLVADQKRIAKCGRRIVGDQDVRHGVPAAAAAAWARASSSMPACTSSGGPLRRISDRRASPVTGVECPGGSAGATRELMQVVDRRERAERRRQHRGQCGRQLLG